MENFLQVLARMHSVPAAVGAELTKSLTARTYRKGDFLLRGDQACDKFYFINRGLVKLFFTTEEKTFIMHFFKEEAFFTELRSFHTEVPSRYMLVALEPTQVQALSKFDIDRLCAQHHSVEKLFSTLRAMAATSMMGRISEMLEADGTKRYHNFLQHNRDIAARISLGDLADYIGVTQASLSRIRARP